MAALTSLFVAVAVLSACSSALPPPSVTLPGTATSANGDAAAPHLDWQSCNRRYQCATMTVPLDYSGATPGTVQFGLMRWPAADPANRIGSLIINPGGPGGSGTAFLQSGFVQGWTDLHQRFDIIGFDPRGVGPVGDVVDCVDNMDDYWPVADPYTVADRASLAVVAKEFADACEQRDGNLLPYLSAETVARDIDQVRAALGEEQISYLGLSYGTYLGAMYAELFPEHVRAMVLDGAVDPALPPKQWQEQQAIGFEHAFDAFAADCDQDRSCPLSSLPGGAEGSYDRLMASLEQQPLTFDGRSLGRSEAEMAVSLDLYNQDSWPFLAQEIAEGLDGDGAGLMYAFDAFTGRNSDGTYDNMMEVYRAVSCVDLAFPTDLAEYDAWATEFEQAAPRFGRALAYEHLDCAFWAAPPVTIPTIDASGAASILVVGTSNDPATPYVWAQSLAKELLPGELLTVEGEGHTAMGKNTCATATIDQYLLSATLPPDETTCPADN